jgi:CRISPR-associated protein Cmr3
MSTLFIEPLDVLFLRGSKLFGDPGSFGESLVPPWPSVAAGAIRSRMLADDGVDLALFACGEVAHPALGTPANPGSFSVAALQLARRHGNGRVEMLIAPPADLVVLEDEAGQAGVRSLSPVALSPARLRAGEGETITAREGLACSGPLPLLPVLGESARSKPASGYWLTEAGWKQYLAGKEPEARELVTTEFLWKLDHRVGVGLDAATRRAADGRLFSMQAVAFREGVGFLAAVSGATPPQGGTVRLGGDGRAAALHAVGWSMPEPDYAAIAVTRRCRLVLTTPGLFADGWLPTGADASRKREDGAVRFDLHGVRGWIVCAAVPRAEVVSGWDLANWEPKPAQRAAPAGSVWWLELDEGVSADVLRKLAEAGLWREPCEDPTRRAEGFNRIAIAAY